MKNVLLLASAVLAVAGVASAANAADMAPAAYDWSGAYVGLNAGAGINNSNISHDFAYTGPYDLDVASQGYLGQLGDELTGDQTVFTGGAILGYNWQHDSLVLGVETDFNYLGFGDSSERDFGSLLDTAFDANPGTYDAKHKLSFEGDWYGTLRGRIGYAADNILFYGTGGLAYGHMSVDSKLTATDGNVSGSWDGSADSVNWGWTAGAGVEYGIDKWSLGLEYMYVDLGSTNWESDGTVNANAQVKDFYEDFKGDGGFDYRFSVVRATAKLRF